MTDTAATATTDPAATALWVGRLQVGFTWNNDRTTLTGAFAQAPCALSRPLYPNGPETCHVMVLHNAGGMVAGDRVELTATVADGARAVLTTASAGKIYRSTGAQATQAIRITVGAGATLAWAPLETIVFNGANYRQDLTVELAPGGSYLGWDLVRFGRTAGGERFLNGAYRAHTTINRSGRPLWIDRQRLDGGEAALTSEQGLAGKSVVGTLVWIGLPLADTVVAEARAAWSAMAGQGEAGVTVVAAGLVCRYRGESTAEARQWFSTVWDLLSATGAPQRAGHHSLAVTGWRC